MAHASYEDVLKLAEQLPENEQNKLIAHLRARQTTNNPTREELILELESLRSAGAFENAGSLYGVFANPDAPDISDDELHAQLHAFATEWEQELTSSIPTTIDPLYVVDTHALIWYLTGNKKLSPTALTIFRAAERGETRLLLPAIVLAELYYANVKNKWFADFVTVYRAILSKPFFKLLAFDPRHVLDFDRDAAVPEMHDRMIAGTARQLSAPLISADPLITQAGVVRVVW